MASKQLAAALALVGFLASATVGCAPSATAAPTAAPTAAATATPGATPTSEPKSTPAPSPTPPGPTSLAAVPDAISFFVADLWAGDLVEVQKRLDPYSRERTDIADDLATARGWLLEWLGADAPSIGIRDVEYGLQAFDLVGKEGRSWRFYAGVDDTSGWFVDRLLFTHARLVLSWAEHYATAAASGDWTKMQDYLSAGYEDEWRYDADKAKQVMADLAAVLDLATVRLEFAGLDPLLDRVHFRLAGTKDGIAAAHAFSIVFEDTATGLDDPLAPGRYD